LLRFSREAAILLLLCSSVSREQTFYRKFKSEMIPWTMFFAMPVTSAISRTFTLRSFLIKPSTLTQFSSVCEALGLPLVSVDHHSVPFGHL
jgi:hypothetical protein